MSEPPISSDLPCDPLFQDHEDTSTVFLLNTDSSDHEDSSAELPFTPIPSNYEHQLDMRTKHVRTLQHRRPSCTHIVMDKAYGTDFRCCLCGSIPSMGWIYVCQQDTRFPQPTSVTEQPDLRALVELPSTPSSLKLLGCSESVVAAAYAGHYTPDQIRIMINQKIHVRKMVAAQLEQKQETARPLPKVPCETPRVQKGKLRKDPPASIKKDSPGLSKKDSSTSAKKDLSASTKNDASASTKQPPAAPTQEPSIPKAEVTQTCDFKCCYTCRPLSRDRAVSSIESVLSEPNEIFKPWNPHYQPVLKASIIYNIDTERCILPIAHDCVESVEDEMQIEDDQEQFAPMPHELGYVEMLRQAYANHSLQNNDQEPPESQGFRLSWKKALDDMVRVRQGASRGMDLARGTHNNRLGTLEEHDDDDDTDDDDDDAHIKKYDSELELFKRLSNELQREASNVSLPTPDLDHDSLREVSSFLAEEEDEKHVKGGIAVTEEAIENKAPDIITD